MQAPLINKTPSLSPKQLRFGKFKPLKIESGCFNMVPTVSAFRVPLYYKSCTAMYHAGLMGSTTCLQIDKFLAAIGPLVPGQSTLL